MRVRGRPRRPALPQGLGGGDDRPRGRRRRRALLVPGALARRRCGRARRRRGATRRGDRGGALLRPAALPTSPRRCCRSRSTPGGRARPCSWRATARRFTLTLAAARRRARARRGGGCPLDRETLRPVRLRQLRRARATSRRTSRSRAGRDGQPARRCEIRRPARGLRGRVHASTRSRRNVPVPERAFVPRTPEGYAVVEVRLSTRPPRSSETIDLRMVYHVGHVEVQALRGVDIQVQRGEFVVHHRALRLRQVHAAAPAGRPGPAHRRAGSSWTASRSPRPADAERTAVRREKIGFVFQRFNLLPDPDRAGQPGDRAPDPGATAPPRASGWWSMLEMVGLPHKIGHEAAGPLGGRAAAHRHRPRPRQRPRHRAGRRAHRQPRLREQHDDPRAVPGPEPAAAARRS